MKLNTIYNENCLETMARMPDGFVDLTVTSPMYDDMRSYKNAIGDQWNLEKFTPIAKDLYRVTKHGGVVVWIVGDKTRDFCESLTSFKQAIFFVEECGFRLLDTMIYEKNNGPAPYPNMKRYAPWSEYMFVLSKGKPGTFNPIKDRPTKSGAGKRNSGNSSRQKDGSTKATGEYITKGHAIRHNVWSYHVGMNKDTTDKIAMSFPARFPEKLAEDHILSWSNPGELVYDPFMGSGTTAKMAFLNNRKYIGSEISTEYWEMSVNRMAMVMENNGN